MCFGGRMSRISLSIHYHPLFVWFKLHRTKQRICFQNAERNEWQVLLFDFQITQPSLLLTRRVNKCRIQFPWIHTISWQSSKRSNGLLQGTWATVKKALGLWKVLTPWASHKERQMSHPQKQLLGEPLVLKTAGSLFPYAAELLPQHLAVVVS